MYYVNIVLVLLSCALVALYVLLWLGVPSPLGASVF